MSLPQPERRQVLKAGALAWTVPVVAMATAAPAYATSGSNLSTSTATTRILGFWSLAQRIETTVVLRNAGSGPTTALSVTISIAEELSAAGLQPLAPAGWTLTTLDTAGDAATFTRNTQLAAGANETVVFVLRRSYAFAGDSVTVVVTPAGGGVGATLTPEVGL
ncbi:hypothetical protein [Nocardioides sp.]|uniref:hypothetical protein n=1 Tax=Nocardioides sp. TaxID=35761 RepID=UPI002610FB21|nr:hypothetical protein [Nocardioides sp.]MCW2739316.1 hypothetical protein [Nocardioides sp.]